MLRRLLKRGIDYLVSPDYRFSTNSDMGWYDTMPDEEFLKRRFQSAMGMPLNLEAPKTFSEKLQWLKLYDRRPEYTVMADKLLVRNYIAQKLGSEYLIPLLGVWDDPEDIDFAALPQQFVLKCNHNSGQGMCICEDKAKLNIPKVKRELRRGLHQNYYLTGREWPYRDIPRKIICEQFMTDGGKELSDIKVHNFNGEPRFILVCCDRFRKTGLTEDFFTPQWEHIPVKRPRLPLASKPIPKPEQLEKILELSRILSRDIPFVRTDFYLSEGKIYFGEMTFFPGSGFLPFQPESWDETFGNMMRLPEKTLEGIKPKLPAPLGKRILSAAGRYLGSADYRFLIHSGLGFHRRMPDEEYLKRIFRAVMKKELDLQAPKTFNEKLQWLKLYDRRPEYVDMADKVNVRDYIAGRIGPEYLVPLVGVWDDPEDIDFAALPEQFVLKCNHNSGLGMCICKDKTRLDIPRVKKDLRRGLRQDYYLTGREWPYKDIRRRIVGEVLLKSPDDDVKDYKFMCFDGEVKCSFVCSERFTGKGMRVTFFDRDWNVMPLERSYPRVRDGFPRPKQYEKMVSLAQELSRGIPFLRVDFYVVGEQIYCGELTFFPGNGVEAFSPECWDKTFGAWLTLPENKATGDRI